jgi:hypothetical protein
MLKGAADSSDASMSEFPVLKASPLYIQQSLLFPYSEGTVFFAAVYKKLGQKSFAAVFEDPPVDTAQIIHPDRYFAHVKPTQPALPTVSTQQQGKEITEGSLGEFDHVMLLRQYDGEELADSLAPHLRGGRFEILALGKDQSPLLEYASEWDSPEEAARFFHAYQKVLKGKWKRYDRTIDKETIVAGTSESGYFISRVNGLTVTSIEGLRDSAEWHRLENSGVTRSPANVAFRLAPQGIQGFSPGNVGLRLR